VKKDRSIIIHVTAFRAIYGSTISVLFETRLY